MNHPPEIYYGLHMVPGVAEYRDAGKDSYRIYIDENTCKSMDPGFSAKPVYVDHVDKVDLDKADGWVIESFYNQVDGKHWAKFVAVSDKAKEAIRMGYKLSNAYIPKDFGGGGLNHGVEYQKEITNAEYEHLAIVQVPRYEESVILTAEQFKQYCEKKEMDLAKVANSVENEQGENTVNFFKKTKVENSLELEKTIVELPKSKVEVSVSALINEMDEYRLKMKEPNVAEDGFVVNMGDDKQMSVKELKDCYNEFMGMKKMNEEKMAMEEEEKKKNETSAEEEKKAPMEEKKKEMKGKDGSEDEKDKAKNEEEEMMKMKKANELKFYNELANADKSPIREERTPDLSGDRIARGKSRYGSN